MRFACQSCGKAYSLPEERIADKSNVKLKCRVCGAIVEVKRQGELVAQLLDEVDGRRVTRVSEAPAPLISLTPEDDEADGATVSISEGSLSNGGPLQFEMPSVPLAPPTGFSAGVQAVGMPPAALPLGALSGGALSGGALSGGALSGGALSGGALSGGSSGGTQALPPPLADAGVGLVDGPRAAPPLGPPPLSPSSLPPPPLRADAPGELPGNGSGSTLGNGAANGRSEFFGDVGASFEQKPPELLAPVAANAAAALSSGPASANVAASSSGPVGMASVNSGLGSPGLGAPGLAPGVSDLSEPLPGEVRDPMLKFKMLAAFLTGVVVDRIIAGLFQ